MNVRPSFYIIFLEAKVFLVPFHLPPRRLRSLTQNKQLQITSVLALGDKNFPPVVPKG